MSGAGCALLQLGSWVQIGGRKTEAHGLYGTQVTWRVHFPIWLGSASGKNQGRRDPRSSASPLCTGDTPLARSWAPTPALAATTTGMVLACVDTTSHL